MKSRYLMTMLAAALSAFSAPAAGATKLFGEPLSLKTATTLEQAISGYDKVKDTDILVSGQVGKVCQKKGCWMTIRSGNLDVRITFKDYKFFVPLSSEGYDAKMQGRLEKKEVSVKDQKHYLKDAGASDSEIAAVTAPRTEFSFVASGVELSKK